MTETKFRNLITAITLALSNYLMVAKQSGQIVLIIDADSGDVKRCRLQNTMELKVNE